MSITFGNYNPPKPNKTLKNEEFSIFIDGTLNNKYNSRVSKYSAVYKKYGEKGWFMKNAISEKKDSSYDNDLTNVARMFENCPISTSIYVEGIGTDYDEKAQGDNKYKSDDTAGYAYGSGKNGIIKKVHKAMDFLANRLKNKKIETLTLDVFGFSRGAAAARHFVFEINKPKDKSHLETTTVKSGGIDDYEETTITVKVDSYGNRTTLDNIPPYGYFGLQLAKKNIKVERIKIRFLGLFDTVSSYELDNVANTSPNFHNDVEELGLRKNQKAKHIVHFTAADEHRENFALTPTHAGIEKSFPGVHSDIGGSYDDGKELVYQIETSGTSIKNLNPTIKFLTTHGWYKDKQLEVTGGNVFWALQGTRELKKAYSFIPLHFMSEMCKEAGVGISLPKIKEKFSIINEPLLQRVEKRLRKYVFENGDKMTFKQLPKRPHDNKASRATSKEFDDYNDKMEEQLDLEKLRNEYLHWSADRYGVGMKPTKNRQREIC
jgi:hypothetical protein